MRDKVNTNFDIGKLVFEGMMTVFIVLIFLFIAQNWVLTDSVETSFQATCSVSDGRVGSGEHLFYETNRVIDGDDLILR